MEQVALGNVMVDCGDERALQAFYAELLGWERCELFAKPAVRSEAGMVFLFEEIEGYVPPVWPEEPGRQQKQMHFDFQVEDVEAAVRHALALGADCFITGEMRHHEALDALDKGCCIIEAGHFETENPVCEVLADALQNAADALQYNVTVFCLKDDPFGR